jgi:DNA mismatch repair protein MutS
LDEIMQPAPGELLTAQTDLIDALGSVTPLSDRLQNLLVDEPPFFARDGGFILAGAHAALDEARRLRDESRRVIAGLESRYRAETGIASLKIKHNAVLGYFIEVTATHADKLLTGNGGMFRHRQTVASAVRFSSDELAGLAMKIAQAGETALAIELELFDSLCESVRASAAALARIADALALMDVACALAELAQSRKFARPAIDTSLTLCAAGIRWSKPRCRPKPKVPSRPMVASLRRHIPMIAPDGYGSSPGQTWRANPRFCARTH